MGQRLRRGELWGGSWTVKGLSIAEFIRLSLNGVRFSPTKENSR